MRQSDWMFILHWAPSLGIAFLLGIAALILQAQERRSSGGRRARTIQNNRPK
jgi:hypothetical protein